MVDYHLCYDCYIFYYRCSWLFHVLLTVFLPIFHFSKDCPYCFFFTFPLSTDILTLLCHFDIKDVPSTDINSMKCKAWIPYCKLSLWLIIAYVFSAWLKTVSHSKLSCLKVWRLLTIFWKRKYQFLPQLFLAVFLGL